MRLLFLLLLIPPLMQAQTIVDFKKNSISKNWYIVDDVVMGGRSAGNFSITEEGLGSFAGTVSLENNGGFSSVRYTSETLNVGPNNAIRMRLKGDGNTYQLRVRDNSKRNYSYVCYFETTGDWQTLEFPLKELYPVFRGRRLNLPNFNHNTLEEIGFLIGNKKPQEFQLLIASIELIE